MGGPERGPVWSAWWLHLLRRYVWEPDLLFLSLCPGGPLPLTPILPTCVTGEGRHVPDLRTSCGHPTLPLRTFPLLLPASGLLLPRLLAQPVGGRPHCGWAADTGSSARLGLWAPGVPPRYPSPAALSLHHSIPLPRGAQGSLAHPSLASTLLPEGLCRCPWSKPRPASLRWEAWGTRHSPPFLGSPESPPDLLANADCCPQISRRRSTQVGTDPAVPLALPLPCTEGKPAV